MVWMWETHIPIETMLAIINMIHVVDSTHKVPKNQFLVTMPFITLLLSSSAVPSFGKELYK